MTKVIFEDTGKYSIEEVLEKLREMGIECRIEGEEISMEDSYISNLPFGAWEGRDIDAQELRKQAWRLRNDRANSLKKIDRQL